MHIKAQKRFQDKKTPGALLMKNLKPPIMTTPKDTAIKSAIPCPLRRQPPGTSYVVVMHNIEGISDSVLVWVQLAAVFASLDSQHCIGHKEETRKYYHDGGFEPTMTGCR